MRKVAFDFYQQVLDVEWRMNSEQIAVILKSFDAPDEVRVMQKGKFELVHLGGITIGRATYEPGWKWSEHVGPSVGATRCNVEHVGLVLSGAATAAFDDGHIVELRAGELFYIPPIPHDSWVIGDEPYVHCTFLAQKSTRRKVNSSAGSADYADYFWSEEFCGFESVKSVDLLSGFAVSK
jgi:quercetin dioxygenase-like cupin family protein